MPAQYVWFIRDPRITAAEEGSEPLNIVYVGSGYEPWLSVKRHLTRSSNPELQNWVSKLHDDFPEGIQILDQVVCEIYHGEIRNLPEPTPGITRVEWGILAYEGDRVQGDHYTNLGTLKAYWIKKLKAQGHPLLNRGVGRPLKQKRAIVVTGSDDTRRSIDVP